MIMYKVFSVLLLIGLVACSSKNFVGTPSDRYERLSCALEKEVCRINYSDESYISYSVEEIEPNNYSVSGNVALYMQVVGGMNPRASFFVVFMDQGTVQFERLVKTGTTKSTFEFEVELEKPITKTTIQKVRYHTRS